MPRKQHVLIRQLFKQPGHRSGQRRCIASRQVGPAQVLKKQGVSGEGELSKIKAHTARGVTRSMDRADRSRSQGEPGAVVESAGWSGALDVLSGETKCVELGLAQQPRVIPVNLAGELKMAADRRYRADVIVMSVRQQDMPRSRAGGPGGLDDHFGIVTRIDNDLFARGKMRNQVTVLRPGGCGYYRGNPVFTDETRFQDPHADQFTSPM